MKKSVDLSGLQTKLLEYSKNADEVSKVENAGIGGTALLEPVPNFIDCVNDNIIKGANNTWIVLGRDRPSSRLSGYGGKGDTQAGAIDIVVGRMADQPKDQVYVDPNFETDSARIHISQKSDIDSNFKIIPGGVGDSIARSSVGIKADSIRIIGREGIKLVTGIDSKNSQGGDITSISGIDIIAGNINDEKTSLQPMVKGDNLLDGLKSLSENLKDLSGILSTFLSSQMDFNRATSMHYHYSPFYGIPTTPSDILSSKGIETSIKHLNDCVLGLEKFSYNLNVYKNNYLRPHGAKYINSRFNKVN